MLFMNNRREKKPFDVNLRKKKKKIAFFAFCAIYLAIC